MDIEMVCCEMTLLDEIASKRLTRKLIAMSYALALKSSERDTINWSKVNKAIIDRWSRSGLRWIKHQAWSGRCFAERPTGGKRE